MPIDKTVSGRRFEAITPSDSADIEATRGVFIETTGDIAIIGAGDSASVTIPGVSGGIWHPMSVTRILSTGTDAATVYVCR